MTAFLKYIILQQFRMAVTIARVCELYLWFKMLELDFDICNWK